jgi:hypothetical protein
MVLHSENARYAPSGKPSQALSFAEQFHICTKLELGKLQLAALI